MDAFIFAKRAHEGQVRKLTGDAMIEHPSEVARILEEAGFGVHVICAGFLHDTIEDTDVTEDHIVEWFGENVLRIVLSNTEDKNLSWEERKQHTIDHIADLDIECRSLLVADKLSNLRSLDRGIREHGDAVFGNFKRGRDQQAWYFGSVADRMYDNLDKSEAPVFFEEYRLLVDRVFG